MNMKSCFLWLCCLLLPSSVWASGYAATRYPIVLAHGMFGFNDLAGVEYWYGIPEALRAQGANVYVTQVSPLNTSVQRGEQLLAEVETILAVSGSAKVNLIGHSHGGQSIRYVAAMIPTHVASITAVGSPGLGSPVADDVLAIGKLSPALESIALGALQALGQLIALLSNNQYAVDISASLQSLSSSGAAAFNSQFPAGVPSVPCGQGASQVAGVYIFSWGGTAVSTNIFDLSDALLLTTSLAFVGQPNDGLVGRCSSHLGRVLNDSYDMNHLDEVNQLFGLHALWVNPVELYLQQANRLKNMGL